MRGWIDRLVGALVVGVVVFALIAAAPTREAAALHLFRVFVPLTLICGIGIIIRAIMRWRRDGWSRPVEAYLAAGALLTAWAHDAGRAMVRRAAVMEGYPEASSMEVSSYRLVSGIALIYGSVWLFRWLNYPSSGEWGWTTAFLLWSAFVLFADSQFVAVLVWLYLTFFQQT